MRRRYKTDNNRLLLAVIALIFVGITVFFFFQLRVDRFAEQLKVDQSFCLALLIVDDQRLLFTEILMYHPTTNRAALLDIPGRLSVKDPDQDQLVGIETFFSAVNPRPFIDLLAAELTQTIDFYLLLDIGNTALTDLIGGLTVNIEHSYDNQEAPEFLPSGQNILLDGEKIKIFLNRQKSQPPDTDPSSGAQNFIKSWLRALGSHPPWQNSQAYREIYFGCLDGNLTEVGFKAFIERVSIRQDNVIPMRAMGDYDDEAGLFFPVQNGRMLRQSVETTLSELVNANFSADSLSVVVEVLNGTTVTGLAARTRQLFLDYGYRISGIGNAETADFEKTLIYSMPGSLAKAQKVADFIRCKTVIREISNADLAAGSSEEERNPWEVRVILGRDFGGRYCES